MGRKRFLQKLIAKEAKKMLSVNRMWNIPLFDSKKNFIKKSGINRQIVIKNDVTKL